MHRITVTVWNWIYCTIPVIGLIHSAWQVDRGRVTPSDIAGWPTYPASSKETTCNTSPVPHQA